MNGDGTSVLGINFASATEDENVNFVVPAWRVQQMLSLHHDEQGNKSVQGPWERRQVHIPFEDLVAIEANPALYSISGGCHDGIFISEIGNWSFFKTAKPPIQTQTLLVSVNGIELDKFGMGRNPQYASELVYFTDLVWMRDSLSEDFTFRTCKGGKETVHNASLSWLPEFDSGIRFVEEPTFAEIEYEVFGDVTIMEMTENHVQELLDQGFAEAIHWMHPDLIYSPRLIVSAVEPGSYADDFLLVASAVEKVNGHVVRTLKSYREHFVPDASCIRDPSAVWSLETDMGQWYAVNFTSTLQRQIGYALQHSDDASLTPAVLAAAKHLSLTTSLDFVEVASEKKPELPHKKSKAAGPLLVSKGKHGYATRTHGQLYSR